MEKQTDEEVSADDSLGRLAVMLTAVPLGEVFGGWVADRIWSWFVIPFGLPRLGLGFWVGASLILTVVRPNPVDLGGKPPPVWDLVLLTFGRPAVALFAAWVVRHLLG